MNVSSNVTIYALVHTNWNLLLLLLFLKKLKFDTLILVIENKIPLAQNLLLSKLPFSIKFHYVTDPYKKFTFLKSLKDLTRKDSCSRFIKFTNFSFFGQCMQKKLNSERVIFIDEGTTFINILRPKLTYTPPFKMFFKKFFWPSPFTPSFNCFSGVDEAFIMYSDLIPKHINESVVLRDIDYFFNPHNLKLTSIEWLDVTCEVKHWKEYFNDDHHALVLGSPYIAHKILKEQRYLKLIGVAKQKAGDSFIYKKHPTESSKTYLNQNDLLLIEKLDVPAELLFAYYIPSKVVSFGSTSGFMLKYFNSESSVTHVLPKEVFDCELTHSIGKLLNQAEIIGV